jgi:hypothetical protein
VVQEGYDRGNWKQMNAQHETLNAQLSRGWGASNSGTARRRSPGLGTVDAVEWRHAAATAGERRTRKHAILRNEPELRTRNCERMLQGGNRLGCANRFFNSGSFFKAESVRREKAGTTTTEIAADDSGVSVAPGTSLARVAQPVLRSACHGSTTCGVPSNSASSDSVYNMTANNGRGWRLGAGDST